VGTCAACTLETKTQKTIENNKTQKQYKNTKRQKIFFMKSFQKKKSSKSKI